MSRTRVAARFTIANACMNAFIAGVLVVAASIVVPVTLHAQEVRIRDLTVPDGATPVRVMGYGIVVGLDGTGDRGTSGRSGGQTVQSIANLLRHFDIEIPAEVLRTRNAAAVLVTAEVSPYLRPGAHFDVNVASLGDARSLRGGTLWMTPLVTDAGAQPVATAQGAIIMSDGNLNSRDAITVETSGRISAGGLIESEIPHTALANVSRLSLKEPDITTAQKIASAINQSIGANSASVEDPGAVLLTLPASGDRAATLVRIQDLKVTPDHPNRLVIDGRDGTVVAGGDITVGAAVVSHGGVTLVIGSAADLPPARKTAAPTDADAGGTQAVQIQSGSSVQKVAAALQAVQTTPEEIAAIFTSLREVGALAAEITIR